MENIPKIIDAGVKLLISLVTNLPQIISTILNAIPTIISSLVTAIASNIPQLIQTGLNLLSSLVKNLPGIISAVVKAIPQILKAIIQAVLNGISQMASAGLELVKGLWNGLSNSLSWIKDKIKGWVGNVLSFIKNLFGIHSPSKVFAGYGEFLVEGLSEGIEDNTSEATSAMEDMSEAVSKAFNPDLAYSFGELETPNNLTSLGSLDYNVNHNIQEDESWIDRLAEKLLGATDKEIILNVDGRTFAQTSINTINDYTRQTGKLALNLI